MAVKRNSTQDGIFMRGHITASIKDTPVKQFEEGLKKASQQTARQGTTSYILDHLEKSARETLEKLNKAKSLKQESNKRLKRDCESLLENIDLLKTLIERKDTNYEFLMVSFYHLGVLAQRAQIRPIEPLVFHGAKFKGGDRGQGKKAQEWREELYIISQGLEGDKLNFNIILKRIEDSIMKDSTFWHEVNKHEELIFFEDGLKSVSFKTVKNEITNMRKKR